ncbi:ATP-binding cassette domain-containing protein [Olsenella sp. oral taxon 809]|uniref:ATP-binding cassette domain-containing protein n=1 Tax=Olsenella sp. oral taxon 809 TaxID=661086 RepID=UPI001E4EE329|nr:ATP-binding cassette domain-containing protein [Olsenella sp. oral taxon 809]
MDLDMVAARPLVGLRVDAKRVREPNGDRRTLVADSRFVLTERDGSVAIRGRSGAGKTTLLRMLAGLDADYDGEYRLDGILLPKSVRELVRIRQGTIGYVTQVPRLLTDRSVLDNVLLGLSHASHAVEEAGLLLERVGLPLYQRKRAGRLSGGEAQRVALVQTLVRRPRILLADEPTGSLDEETERVILNLLVDLQSEGVRVVVASHSDLVADICGRSVWIREKRLVAA